MPWVPFFVEKYFLNGKTYVLDYDDAVFHNYDLLTNQLLRRVYGNKIRSLIRGSCGVFAGNNYLADYAINSCASFVLILPTVVNLNSYPVCFNKKRVSNFVIGWVGSPSTAKYLKLVESSLKKLFSIYYFELHVVGASNVDIELTGFPVKYITWSEIEEHNLIDDFDVGIMPLHDTPWENGKCGYKLIQYMACSKPVVASPVGVNRIIVSNGVNGFLAKTDQEWFASFLRLYEDRGHCKLMGQNGRDLVIESYSIQAKISILNESFFNLLKSD